MRVTESLPATDSRDAGAPPPEAPQSGSRNGADPDGTEPDGADPRAANDGDRARDLVSGTTAPIPFVDLGAYHSRIRGALAEAMNSVIEQSAFTLGEHLEAFEGRFAAYCGVEHAVGVGSGTSALTLALIASGLERGGEVITVANTFSATAEAIVHAGGTPVLVDPEPRTSNIDVEQVERRLSPRTQAVIAVHLYGRPAEMAALRELCDARGVTLIEDAAQAHGALYRGRRAGSIGDAGCFSFYPSKNLGAMGDGGAVVTNDPAIAARVRALRSHGEARRGEHTSVGFTSRLDALQAAVLNVKLDELDDRNARRHDLADCYMERLADIPGLVLPERDGDDVASVWHLFVVRVPPRLRAGLAAQLRQRGIATGIHYQTPIHRTPAFSDLGYEAGSLPVSEQLAERIISLPIFPELTAASVGRVADEIRSYLSAHDAAQADAELLT